MARPPVCKLMDYGKFKYENAQKAREARRNQTNVIIKEMKLRPKIDAHDYETKKGHVVRFLKAGDKVKITIMFRGREQHRPELGFRLLQRLAEDVTELGFVESAPKQDGRNMIMVLGPHKKKAEAKVEMKAAKAERRPPRAAERGRGARRAHARTTPGTPWRRRRSAGAPRTSTPRSRPDASDRATSGRADRRPRDAPARRQRGRDTMPKNKTHSGASKRFQVTGSGKIRRQKAGLRHNLEQKPSQGDPSHDAAPPRSPRPTSSAPRSCSVADRPAPASPIGVEPSRPLSTQGVTPVARVKRAVNAHKKRRVTLERASGYRGQRSRLYRKAKEQVTHSLVYSYRDRKQARATSASSGSSGSTPRPAPTA